MKKILSIAVLVAISFISHSQSSNLYYWSNKKKIFLVPDSTNWTLLPAGNYSKEVVSSKLKNTSIVSKLQTSLGSNLIDFTLKDHSKEAIQKLKSNLSAQGELMCRQLVDGKTPIILTGEILLQPKKSVSIENVLDLVRAEAKLTKQTEYNTFALKANTIEDVISIANQIYESGLVDWCHPNFWVEIVKTTTDPLYNQQYYLSQANDIDINAPEAFEITQGCNNIRVAVIDDGVENHEDINGRVLQGFTARNANGFGAPVANLPPVNLNIVGHGQACAGIIGATQNNNLGIGGIAPNSRIIPVNIFSDWFIFTDINNNQQVLFRETPQDIAASINWAWNANQGNADVISNSWSFGTAAGPGGIDSDAIRQAITNARTQGRFRNGVARGCIVVFASGNGGSSVLFPANVDGVITVGAINRNGSIWNYSSRGSEMDLVAPSGDVNLQGDITTTDRIGNNGYEAGNYTNRFGGTSAACPQVSGVAALILSVNPNLTEVQVRTILQQTASDMGASGFDNTFGFGRLNAEAALRRVITDLGISVNGPSLICNPTQFTLANQPVGSTLTWSTSEPAGLNINPATGAASRQNNFSGQVAVIATLNIGCGNFNVIRNVWVGEPLIVYHPPGSNPCSSNPWYSGPILAGGLYYSWSVDNANVWFTTYTTNYSSAVISYNPEYFNITLTISDGICSTSTTLFSYTDGYYCQCFFDPACGGGFSRFAVAPNPASNQVDVSFDDKEYEKELKRFGAIEYNLALVDEQGNIVGKIKTSDKVYKWDTSKLPNGTYYLKANYMSFGETKRILIKH